LNNLQALRRRAGDWHRERTFRRALDRVCADPEAVAHSDGRVLSELAYGWGNEAWSASSDYLLACMRQALLARGPVLECGSGLTTIVLGRLAEAIGTTVWSLEHMPSWGAKVGDVLIERGIDAVRLVAAPLKSYGEFDWYDADTSRMPERFSLVICDGPPSSTRGGRFGLVPVMRERLADDCVILLDDAERASEQDTVRRWAQDMVGRYAVIGGEKPFFRFECGVQVAT
jgi:hypothetical protein